jgi:dUTP pyrophosphatase
MKLRFDNKAVEGLFKRATIGSAGIDLVSNLVTSSILKPGEQKLYKTGVFIEELDSQYEAQIRSRSGLALKHGIIVLNAPGTIDSDYRGEIGVILYNASDVEYRVRPLHKIAQLVFAPVAFSTSFLGLDVVRGDSGFGSTGD